MNGAHKFKPKPYPDYRRSEVKWFDRLPTHWEVRRLRNVADLRVSNVDKHEREDEEHVRLCNYVDVYNNDRITAKMSFLHATATPDEIERFRLERGDVLITKDSETWDDIGVPALVSDSAPDLISGYHLALLRPRSECVLGGYLHRALESKGVSRQFHVHARGVTRYGLTHVGIKSVWLPVPPLPEQEAIVRFLDHADRRIQRYICAKQRLVTLLEEQKQVIIHQAVTGQIDVTTGHPHRAYKDSGVGWIGSIPKHWEVIRIGKLIDLTVGFPFKSDGFTQSDYDIRLLRGINIIPSALRWNDVVRWPSSDTDLFHEFRLDVGDIVLGMDRPIIANGIRVSLISESDVPSLLLQRVARIRVRKGLLREFAFRLLSGTLFRHYIEPIFTGISVPHISPQQIKEFRIAIPPVQEQRVIVEYMTRKNRTLHLAMNRIQEMVVLLREYRRRLIADVVTGRLDVRDAIASVFRADHRGNPGSG